MKSFIVFALFVAAAVAAPQSNTPDGNAVIVSQEADNIGTGPYFTEFRTSNGISVKEEGDLTKVGTEDEAMEVRGQYSYIGDDGITYTVTYTAGKEGYVAVGDHIPKA